MDTPVSVLIVEDELLMARLIATILRQEGYNVAGSVAEGAQAVKEAEATTPDLVLMDIKLRGDMDGIEAAQEIRVRLDIPIVYLTGHADHATLTRALGTNPSGYITKPFQESALRPAIEVALYRHRLDRVTADHRRLVARALESMGDGVIVTGYDRRIKSINPFARNMTQWSEEDAVGSDVDEVFSIVSPRDGEPIYPVSQALKDGRTVRLQSGTELVRKDGSRKIVDDAVAPIWDDGGEVVGAVVTFREEAESRRTVEELRTLNERLRELTARAHEMAESKQMQVAQQIQETIAQTLVALKFDLHLLQERIPAGSQEVRAAVRSMMDMCTAVLDVTREAEESLRPSILGNLGVVPAIEWEASRVAEQRGIELAVSVGADLGSLDEQTASGLFRIAREAMELLVPCQVAGRVDIEFDAVEGSLLMEIRDDGRGTQETDLLPPQALALFSIRECARWMGGEAEFEAMPGKGTTLRVRLPLSKHNWE